MTDITERYEQIIDKFVLWAKNRSDIHALIVIGSRARQDHPADDWADLDILIVTSNPDYYTSSFEWVLNIGDFLLTFVEETPGGDLERRVLFKGMLDVDFAIIPYKRIKQIEQMGSVPEIAVQLKDIFGRGMRVLIDKKNIADQIQKIISKVEISSHQPPTEQEFLEVANDFLYHCVFTAKHLQRGELWWSKMCLDCHMHSRLLQLIQWHARVKYGWAYDIWFRGRFLEEWADPRVLTRLEMAFAHYNLYDIQHALLTTMDLFYLLVNEISNNLQYSFSSDTYYEVQSWIKNCLKACIK